MTRRNAQLVALFSIILLVIVVVGYQFRQQRLLKTQVIDTQEDKQYGYPGAQVAQPDEPPPLPADGEGTNAPRSTTFRDGLPVLRYLVIAGELFYLDALQFPKEVPSLATEVQWLADRRNAAEVDLEDNRAARTLFFAPKLFGLLTFRLQVEKQGRFQTIAVYEILVVPELALEADVNEDGRYTFVDLVHILQIWDPDEKDSLPRLAIILSEYERE